MPIQHVYERQSRFVLVTLDGEVGFADMVSFFRAMVAEHLLARAQLVDARTAAIKLDSGQTREIADLVRALGEIRGLGPVAFVAGDAASYSAARRYQALSRKFHPRFRIFWELGEAEGWVRQW